MYEVYTKVFISIELSTDHSQVNVVLGVSVSGKQLDKEWKHFKGTGLYSSCATQLVLLMLISTFISLKNAESSFQVHELCVFIQINSQVFNAWTTSHVLSG